jgi:acetyl esterase/lipase
MISNSDRLARLSHVLRVLIGALSAALASLAVVEPLSWNMLVLKIGVTEWGHVFALPAAVVLLPRRQRDRMAWIGHALGFLAALLSLLSLVRARRLARRLPGQFRGVFGDAEPRTMPAAPPRPTPLVLADVLRGVRLGPVRKRRLAYIQRGERALELDLYQPAQAVAAAPCLVVVHGGSWQGGDSNQIPELNSYLAARGYVVAALNYRLLPEHPFPAARDDVLAAIDFLKTNAADLGIDPRQFVLLGRSAGGQLALLVAYTASDPAIRGAIAFYPPTDLVYGYEHPARKAVHDGIPVIERYLGGSPTSVPEVYAAAAPITHTGPSCPPTLLIHGGRDNLVSPVQSERLARRLAAAGCQHFYLNLPWATHGCDVNFSGPSGQISTYTIERFLAAATSDPRSDAKIRE